MDEKKSTGLNKSVVINSVDRALDVIEYLSQTGGNISVSQISKDLDLYKSTVYRTLVTLENRGYVVQDEESERYSIGPKLYAYSLTPRKKELWLKDTLLPYMQDINDKFKDAVNLGVMDKDEHGIYELQLIASCKSQYTLGAAADLSAQTECYCASMGKCLLAFTEGVDLIVYKSFDMRGFTENTITTYAGLKKELDKVREQHYALDNEEREVGLFCVAVPVINNGSAVASISLSGPTARVRDIGFDEKIAYMKEISKRITKEVFI